MEENTKSRGKPVNMLTKEFERRPNCFINFQKRLIIYYALFYSLCIKCISICTKNKIKKINIPTCMGINSLKQTHWCFLWSVIWEISFKSRFSASLFSIVLPPRLSRITFVSLYFWSCLFNSFILGSIHSCGENTVFFSDNKRIPLWFLWLYTVFDSELSLRLFCWALASMQIGRKAHRLMWWIRFEIGKG